MAKQTKARRAPGPRNVEINPRELWLASLGAVSLSRKQAGKLYDTLRVEGRQLQTRIEKFTDEMSDQMSTRVDDARERLNEAIVPLQQRWNQVAGEVEKRLAPVLERAGLKQAAPKRSRPAAGKKARPAAKKRATSSRARKSA